MTILEARNVDNACLRETPLSPPINIYINSYSIGRADRNTARSGVKNGGGDRLYYQEWEIVYRGR